MSLIRKLVVITMRYNILIRATHIPGVKNDLADKISRLQVDQFLRDCPLAERFPTHIPCHLLPK